MEKDEAIEKGVLVETLPKPISVKEPATNIREYGESLEVEILFTGVGDIIGRGKDCYLGPPTRWIIRASNEGGYNGTNVDLLDVIAWIKEHQPELLEDN